MANQEVGYALSSNDFLVYLDGMPTIKINDVVVSETGLRGWVNAIQSDKVEVLLLDRGTIVPGELFRRTDQNLSVLLGTYLIGRVINPLGIPIDGKRMSMDTSTNNRYELDREAPNIPLRKFITEQFVTGITLVDTLIPIAKGQRQLIVGDAHSGKSTFLIDLIVNQLDNPNTVCIYTCIGKPVTQVRSIMNVLESTGALKSTVVIATSASDLPPLIYIAPQTAFSIAEFFQKNGKDVLLILDDMGVHAKIYREISLSSDRSPGRESYPGDIFYQHSHLVERGGNFKIENGGGSITVLPVLELSSNDISGYISTNLVGMTDGHLMFKSTMRNQGQTPAIDISISVSRVGRQTQNRIQNVLSQAVRALLAEADELETVSYFSGELPRETSQKLKRKQIIMELIRQESLTLVTPQIQVFLLGLVFTTFFIEQDIPFAARNKLVLIELPKKDPKFEEYVEKLMNLKTLEDLVKALEQVLPQLKQICK
jgi:F-type H+-transporting ATPase subunit alpha